MPIIASINSQDLANVQLERREWPQNDHGTVLKPRQDLRPKADNLCRTGEPKSYETKVPQHYKPPAVRQVSP